MMMWLATQCPLENCTSCAFLSVLKVAGFHLRTKYVSMLVQIDILKNDFFLAIF